MESVGIWRKGFACLSWSKRKKKSNIREGKNYLKKKMASQKEQGLWLVTCSKEEIPGARTHRCKNIENVDTSMRIKTCFVSAEGLVLILVCLCISVCPGAC